jgi:outer membrane protein OmpA-like peptidoglycan-associated protein
MRNLRRSNREEEEEESVFVPMTDMTVSFLFILMILLAFFAVRFSDKDTVPNAQYQIVKLERDELRVEKQKLMEEIERLKREKQELQVKLDKLKVENARLLEEIKARDYRIAQLEAEVKELKRRLNEQNPMEAYIALAQVQRLEILRRIEEALKIEFKDQILVEISTENDALRFKGEGLFGNDERTLSKGKRVIVSRLAELVTDAVACYTVNNRALNYSECNPYGIVIEAVQIEGHTDDVGTDLYNIDLSTDRANDAFFTMLSSQEDLLSYLNIRGQPVISVAGYGEMRPVAPNDTPEGKAENRRIDLRLIMYTPRDREQVERIQQQIRDGLRLAVEEAASSGP